MCLSGECQDAECVPDSWGVVTWWRGENDATESVERNRSVVAHGVKYAAGKVGKAFDFDGSTAYIEVPDSADLRLTSALTVEGWVYPRTPGQRYQEIVSKWNGSYSYTLTITPSGKAAFSVCSDGVSSFGTVISQAAIPANGWTHLAVTYDGSLLEMHVNGQFDAATPWNKGIFAGGAPLSIGTSLTAPSFFDGLIDELSLYSTPLTQEEIMTIFQSGEEGKCISTNLQIAVRVNGALVTNNAVASRGGATVALGPTSLGDFILYTLDGKDPSTSGVLYGGPFQVTETGILRAVAYSADLVQVLIRDALTIDIVPHLEASTRGGGGIDIQPAAGRYLENNIAIITAVPQPGWTFLEWQGDASGTDPVVHLQMNRDKRVQAVFGTTLNAQVIGSGSIDVRPPSRLHPYGTPVRLTAVPANGNYLAFWGNEGNGDTNNPIAISLTKSNPTVTAVFSSLGGSKSNSVTVVADGFGRVGLTPQGTKFRTGQAIAMQAYPELGQDFVGWTGAISGSNNPLSFQVESNLVVTAVFTRKPNILINSSLPFPLTEGFRVEIVGYQGDTYEVHASTNLLDWTTLRTVTNDWGITQFTDSSATNPTQGYYRARVSSGGR